MQPLKTVFRSRGFTYTQLKREGLAALYEQCAPGGTPAYEVIRIQVYPAEERWGKPYPERESYPGDNQWGKSGWTHGSLEKAEAAFARLVVHLQRAADEEGSDDDIADGGAPYVESPA